MKNYLIALFSIALISMSSCSKDDDEQSAPDPQGTITANISESTRISFFDEYMNYEILELYLYFPNNFIIYGKEIFDHSYSKWYYCYISVCNVGKIRGLGDIKKIPQTGFSTEKKLDTSIACEVGYGYVFKIRSEFSNRDFYVRLYVEELLVSTLGGIIGAKVKYQYPFEP